MTIRLVNRIGDALLARLVPGANAKANCGQCRFVALRCGSCPQYVPYRVIVDDCGHDCGSYCDYRFYCA
jgi:hypothetical protein